ncbi:hypothetical protein [Plantactinospora sp. KBS50]|uniref:hypothetical protein n=1 Tax=Plantactinospora sp. KBS50 TaxID=2024580 RepID=UPI0012FE79B4|nr:hypothetical protein [Plantactinospora sp. KBS50]
MQLAQGPAAEQGYYYAISLSGFPPQSDITVVCRDSITPDGFKTGTLRTDDGGIAASESFCYSGEGEEHWITANGQESNRVRWVQSSGSPSAASVLVAQGAAAPSGYWYIVTLRGFRARSEVTVICRDSADPDGFKTFTMRTDNSGIASTQRACFSGEGAEHWVTANGTASNRVRWTESASGQVILAQGAAADAGYWYVVRLRHFPARSDVTLQILNGQVVSGSRVRPV